MADDEKDRLGDQLRRKEKGEEERFFAEQERKLLERLRQPKTGSPDADPVARSMRCPHCGDTLVSVRHEGAAAGECPAGHGIWLDQADVANLATRERDSWLGRFFHRPRR